MGILNCSNKGPGPRQRGDNHKNGNVGNQRLQRSPRHDFCP